MQILINFIIFIVILFLYVHINYHLKTSNDLEIFEADKLAKDNLEEICNFKQPVLFNFDNTEIIENISSKNMQDNYKSFDINIRNIKDYDLDDNTFLPINYNNAQKLFINDLSNTYISENNNDFINETTLHKHIISNDMYLRPYMTSSCSYDILLGSVNSHTPLRYELNYRNFYLVTDGEIEIMLTIPQNYKYLDIIKDYSNFEFRSKMNPYNIDKKHENNFSKVKFLTVTLKKNDIIYIPPRWFYSIKIIQPNTIVCIFKYMIIMNNLAILPEFFMKFLQDNNIKHKFLNIIN